MVKGLPPEKSLGRNGLIFKEARILVDEKFFGLRKKVLSLEHPLFRELRIEGARTESGFPIKGLWIVAAQPPVPFYEVPKEIELWGTGTYRWVFSEGKLEHAVKTSLEILLKIYKASHGIYIPEKLTIELLPQREPIFHSLMW